MLDRFLNFILQPRRFFRGFDPFLFHWTHAACVSTTSSTSLIQVFSISPGSLLQVSSMLQGILFKSAIRGLVSTFFKERKEIPTCLPPFLHLEFAFCLRSIRLLDCDRWYQSQEPKYKEYVQAGAYQNIITVLKSESAQSGMQEYIYKALLKSPNSDTFYAFSSNFYQHYNLYNILLARRNTYKLDRQSRARCCRLLHGCIECRFQYQSTNTICEKNKEG